MPRLSEKSIERLASCHSDLRLLFSEVSKYYDCTIVCGHRGEPEQTEAFRTGKSKVQFPNSKHNSYPSLAVDVVPFPIDWNDLKRFYHFCGYVAATANRLGIKIRSGSDWDGDFDFKDQNFHDLPHWELILDKDDNKQGE